MLKCTGQNFYAENLEIHCARSFYAKTIQNRSLQTANAGLIGTQRANYFGLCAFLPNNRYIGV